MKSRPQTRRLSSRPRIDPRKWICVGVDEAKVVSKGKLVCVVMDDENGDYYINNFKANA